MRKKYVPDLAGQMASCEANYLRLMKLMPDLDGCDRRAFRVSWRRHSARVQLQVEERFTYTTTVRISQFFDKVHWLKMPDLIVRLYHDARMAEVICRKRRCQLKGSYSYPNDQMHHPDEKAQLNRYLGEWLAQCMAHGHTTDDLAIA